MVNVLYFLRGPDRYELFVQMEKLFNGKEQIGFQEIEDYLDDKGKFYIREKVGWFEILDEESRYIFCINK